MVTKIWKYHLANQNDLKKRFSKDIEAKLTQKLALKVNNNDLLLEAGKVAYGQDKQLNIKIQKLVKLKRH
nr:hypothetical protein [Mycoplasmopsis bovis]